MKARNHSLKKYNNSMGKFLQLTSLALCLIVMTMLSLPLTVHAKASDKVVRVGWFDSPFNMKDENGRRSGYSYQYQQEIAAHTGWSYEYVEGSWSELMQMLVDGKIDLMSDVSFTEERNSLMLFPTLPMGTEDYYLFVSSDNSTFTSDNISGFNQKKIGVNKGSVQENFLIEWANANGIDAEIVELTGTSNQALTSLRNGEIDAYVTLDGIVDPNAVAPICKIGASDFYFAVNLSRHDLLNELNSALSKIQEHNRYYNLQLNEKYISGTATNLFFNETEKKWLSEHNAVRVGYLKDNLAFCGTDTASGKLTGALNDCLTYASGMVKNHSLSFEPVEFSSISEALEALDDGRIDCVFPINFTKYDGEKLGLSVTPSLMNAEIYEIIRTVDKNEFANKEIVTVAVIEKDLNTQTLLQQMNPQWEIISFPDIEACLDAVADEEADCVLLSNYRYNNLSRLCEKYGLSPIATGKSVDYCFAVSKNETGLYSILTKVTGIIPSSKVSVALSSYMQENSHTSVVGFIKEHLALVMTVVAAVLLMILLMLCRILWVQKKAKIDEALIATTEIDSLTGLYCKNFLFEYADRMRNKYKGIPMDAIVLDIDRFHSVNILNGTEISNQILQLIGEGIRSIFSEEDFIAGRVDADRFCIYCWHRNDYQKILTLIQNKLSERFANVNIRLRMGVMPEQITMDVVKMYDSAHVACDMSKGQNNSLLTVFDSSVRDNLWLKNHMLNDLHRAVKNKEFEIYYQPQYDIQSNPPRLRGAEALVRWNHPVQGVVMPGNFIPLFEEKGVIGEVDKCVWKMTARQIAAWKNMYGITVPVSVNLSQAGIFDPKLEETLDELMKANKLERTALKLEITESAYIQNSEQVIPIIERLRNKGYIIELDDFGTDYSSLSTLSSMPIDVLKLDRSFIMKMHDNDSSKRMIKMVMDIAKDMNIPVIAEGVEDKIELKTLKEMGCNIVQGYYFSRPIPAEEFEKLLNKEMEKHIGHAQNKEINRAGK